MNVKYRIQNDSLESKLSNKKMQVIIKNHLKFFLRKNALQKIVVKKLGSYDKCQVI